MKKIFHLLLLALLCLPLNMLAADAFYQVWDATTKTLTLKWGDMSQDENAGNATAWKPGTTIGNKTAVQKYVVDPSVDCDAATAALTTMQNMFNGASALVSIEGMANLHTDNVTTMYYMFSGCLKLQSVDVSKWNTSKVTTMVCMFRRCNALKGLDVSNWNTSKVTNMGQMFSGCYAPEFTTLDVSNWDVSNVQYITNIFIDCKSLKTLDVSKWVLSSKATDITKMFNNCSSLTELDLRGWNTSNVTNMTSLFDGCSALTTILVDEGWNTDKVTTSSKMFSGCKKLVGQEGTTYNGNYIDKTYAIIDGNNENDGTPGYLTNTPYQIVDASQAFEYDIEGNPAVKLLRTFKANTWNTLVLPFALDETLLKKAFGEDVQLAKMTSCEGKDLYFEPFTSIEDNTPFMVKPAAEVENPRFRGVELKKLADVPQLSVSGAVMYGNYTETPKIIDDNYYYYSDNTFYQSAGHSTVRPTRCYFSFSESNGAKHMVYNNDGTSISTIENTASPLSNVLYNLAGQRVGKDYKGVVIINGKKVMNK